MRKTSEQNKILKRALWLAAIDLDTKANPNDPCPNPEHCCDNHYIVESLLRRAEASLGVSYGMPTYEEELAEMRARARLAVA
jgi:hypothetical protein